jgi:hypothetical protein
MILSLLSSYLVEDPAFSASYNFTFEATTFLTSGYPNLHEPARRYVEVYHWPYPYTAELLLPTDCDHSLL